MLFGPWRVCTYTHTEGKGRIEVNPEECTCDRGRLAVGYVDVLAAHQYSKFLAICELARNDSYELEERKEQDECRNEHIRFPLPSASSQVPDIQFSRSTAKSLRGPSTSCPRTDTTVTGHVSQRLDALPPSCSICRACLYGRPCSRRTKAQGERRRSAGALRVVTRRYAFKGRSERNRHPLPTPLRCPTVWYQRPLCVPSSTLVWKHLQTSRMMTLVD